MAGWSGGGQVLHFFLCRFGGFRRTVLEAEAVVAGLQNVAVVGEPIEQRGRHLGVAEDRGPLAEAEVGGDDDAGAFVEPAEQVEEQSPARGAERQVAEFVEDDEAKSRLASYRSRQGGTFAFAEDLAEKRRQLAEIEKALAAEVEGPPMLAA